MQLRISQFLLVVLVHAVITQVARCEKEPTDPSDWKTLVSTLASPNSKPTTAGAGGRPTVSFPAEYDFAAQKQIVATRQKLYDNFEAALPALVDALEDKRYCLTIDWAEGDAYYNWSVGKICRDIIASHLEVYRDAIHFGGPQHWNRYNYRVVSREWYVGRKDKSLAELQIEAIDWAIEKRENEDDAPNNPADELNELRNLRDQIKKSGKSIKPNRMIRAVIAPRSDQAKGRKTRSQSK